MTDRQRGPPSMTSGAAARACSLFPSSPGAWRQSREGEGSRLDWVRKLEFERRKDRERSSSRKGSGYARQRVRLARHKIRRRGGTVPPTSNQPPCGAQGRRLFGPAMLRTCPFASLLGQVRARFGPGGYCRRSRNGGPQTCLPAAHSMAKKQAVRPFFISKTPKTLARIQAPRGGRRKTSSGVA